MAPASQDLLFRFLGIDDGAGAQFDRMAGKAKTTGSSLLKLGAVAGVAGAVIAVESIKAASSFQQSTELMRTQAGQTQAQVDFYRKSILSLAGATATAPLALSDAMYHLVSTGVSGAKAINELKIAAEGAKVGGADLTDVTNALNATIVSGIPGVKGFSGAMGALNAIVGTGDMHMEDLAQALGTGVLIAVKSFGVTLPQAGAALATFGDNNIRGAQAATTLRMAVQALAHPVVSASAAFAQLGLTGQGALQTFAKDMQSGGLTKALTDLHTRLVATGNDGNKLGTILVDAFGKKAGVGIAILEEEFGRFETKQDEIKQGAAGFSDAWAATTKNLAFQFDQMRADVDVLAVQIGDDLIPAALGAIHGFEDMGTAVAKTVGFFQSNKVAAAALAAVLVTALAPAAAEAAASLAATAYEEIGIRALLAKDAIAKLSGSMVAGGAATLGLAAVVGAGVYAWEKESKATAAAKQSMDDWVASLKTIPNSTASVSTALTSIQGKIKSVTQAGAKTDTTRFGLLGNSTQTKIDDLNTHFKTLSATQKLVATNTRDMGAEFNLSASQVVSLANKMGPSELGKSTQQVEADFKAATTAAGQSRDANKVAGSAFADMGSQATTAAQGLTDLTNAFNALLGNFLDVKQAQLAFKNGMVELDGALKKSHDSLTLNTAAGREARGDYLSQAQAIETTAEAVFKNTGSTQAARKATAAMRAELAKTPASGALVTATMHKIEAAMRGMSGSMQSGGEAAGVHLGAGIIIGIDKMHQKVATAAASLGAQAISEANRAMGNASPSKKMIEAGKNVDLGLAKGISDNADVVTKPIKGVAKLLFEGLSGGWTGEAAHIKDALTTPVQNALAKLNSMLDAQESKDKARVKSAESTLKQAIANRKSSIASLQSSIAGGSDISGVLNQTDINGNSYTGNVGQFLKAQIGPLRTEARDLALLRKKGLSQALLSQISAMSPTDAVSVMQQIISGQDGSIASLNASESAIQKYAKQSASTVVNSPAEKRAIARDKEQVKVAKEQLKKLDHIANLLEHRVSDRLAAHLTVDGNGKVKWDAGSIKEMVKWLNKEIQAGHVRIAHS